jgi:hypothetical protein
MCSCRPVCVAISVRFVWPFYHTTETARDFKAHKADRASLHFLGGIRKGAIPLGDSPKGAVSSTPGGRKVQRGAKRGEPGTQEKTARFARRSIHHPLRHAATILPVGLGGHAPACAAGAGACWRQRFRGRRSGGRISRRSLLARSLRRSSRSLPRHRRQDARAASRAGALRGDGGPEQPRAARRAGEGLLLPSLERSRNRLVVTPVHAALFLPVLYLYSKLYFPHVHTHTHTHTHTPLMHMIYRPSSSTSARGTVKYHFR